MSSENITWQKTKSKILKLLWNILNIVDIKRKMYEKSDVETIVDTDEILWLNERHIEEGVDHKNLWVQHINLGQD